MHHIILDENAYVCYNRHVMGKCIKNIALSVMAAIFGALALSGPVFAVPTPDNTPETPETTVTAPETPTETPTTTVPAEEAETSEETTQEGQTCYDQVGNLGWIVCPGTGLLSKIIDGAYGLLTQVIEVNPIPTDHESPYYIVWEYFKNITNLIFVGFFLVVIFSQITGIGINNYGIKKVLPRIIITAILVNLSYIVCTIAVDISNILGNSLHNFFINIQDIAIQNGTIPADAKSTSVAAITYAILGIGAAGAAGTALVFAGSIEGLLWMLAPVLLSGVIAVLSALIIMAARQALIYLLVMISPLALVAYMLPNTEQWFSKWYKLFARMIMFYPMFSVLYGASQLAGLVIIASSDNPFMKVLGMAVEIVPLFMSIPLMKMSGTALNKIDGIFNRMTSPLTGAAAGYAASKSALAKQKALAAQNPTAPHTRLAQYLERQRAKREFDTKELAAHNADRNLTASMQGWYKRDGTLSARGLRHYENERAKLDNAAIRTNIESDFDEGFKTDGTDKHVGASQRGRIARTNGLYEKAIVDSAAADARKHQVTLDNMENRAKLIHDHVEKNGNSIHQDVLDTFNIDTAKYDAIKAKKDAYDDAVLKNRAIEKKRNGEALTSSEAKILQEKGNTLTAAEQSALRNGPLTSSEKTIFDAGQKAINVTLADAITAKRKVDKEARSNYYELYDDYESGPRIKKQLIDAFQNKDHNAMSAALEVMYKRGDKDDIGEVLQNYSKEAYGEDNIRFQKELNDICLTFKSEDIDVAQWAKANMMRRGMNGKGKDLEAYIDYETWAKGELLAGDHDFKAARKTSRVELGNALSSWEAIASADRTMWNQMLDAQKAGVIAKDADGREVLATYPIKYLRSAVCSGKMDGERLESFNKFFTGGYDSSKSIDDPANAFFKDHKEAYAANILNFLGEMTAPQLSMLKTATITKLNETMLAVDAGKDNATITINGQTVSKRLHDALNTQINQLNTEKSMASQRTGMNPAVRKLLGVND